MSPYSMLYFILFIVYSLLARKCGYKMISFSELFRIALPAVIAAIPVIIINQFFSGIISVVLGPIVFALLY